MPDLTPSYRDGYRCVCCDERLDTGYAQASEHHRILGNRADRRLSVLILLQGSGSSGCHWRWHVKRRAEGERRGYIIRRGRLCIPTLVPVWYQQPTLGRVGWHQLTDDGNFTFIDAPEQAHAMDLARELGPLPTAADADPLRRIGLRGAPDE